MFGIKIKSTFLTLYPETQFDFELGTSAYFGGDINEIGNGFVFSVKVPLYRSNIEILQYPHVADNMLPFLKNEECSIFKNGKEVFRGELSVKKAYFNINEPYADVSILINAFAKLKEMRLCDLDLGVINAQDFETYATATLNNPLDYPCCFFPIYNTKFGGEPTFQNTVTMQNQYNCVNETILNSLATAYSAHLRVGFLLEKIFENVGFELRNEWQTSTELQLLYAISYDRWSFFADAYTLKNAASKSKITAWLGRLCRAFNLSIYVNAFAKTVTIKPFDSILQETTAEDWTQYLLKDSELEFIVGIPAKLTTTRPKFVPDLTKLPITFANPTHTSNAGLYYLTPDALVYHEKRDTAMNPNSPHFLVYKHETEVLGGDGSDTEIEFAALPTANQSDEFYNAMGTGNYLFYPAPYTEQPAMTENDTETPDHFTFYRGFHTYRNLRFPLATSEANDYWGGKFLDIEVLEDAPPQYSLSFTAPSTGLYIKNWASTIYLLQNSKKAKMRFALPTEILTKFNFDKKVKVKNLHFLAKTIKGTLKEKGDLIEVEIELIKTI